MTELSTWFQLLCVNPSDGTFQVSGLCSKKRPISSLNRCTYWAGLCLMDSRVLKTYMNVLSSLNYILITQQGQPEWQMS